MQKQFQISEDNLELNLLNLDKSKLSHRKTLTNLNANFIPHLFYNIKSSLN